MGVSSVLLQTIPLKPWFKTREALNVREENMTEEKVDFEVEQASAEPEIEVVDDPRGIKRA